MRKIKKICNVLVICGLILNNINCLSVKGEEYEYDLAGRVVKTIYDDGRYVEYQYDSNGNIVNIETVNSILDSEKINISKAFAQLDKDKKDSIRFVATIDNLNYKEVGFIMSIENENPILGKDNFKFVVHNFYNSIYSNDTVLKVEDINSLDGGSKNGDKIYTLSVINITDNDKVIYATPYAIDNNSKIIYGESTGFSLNDLTN
jgi:YD repeat-containing protein